jgi:pyruvate formate lyase activating enzyme
MFNEANPQWMEKFDRLVKVTDLVMLDIKHIDDEEHKKLTSHSNKNILAFAKYLDRNASVWTHAFKEDVEITNEEMLNIWNGIMK